MLNVRAELGQALFRNVEVELLGVTAKVLLLVLPEAVVLETFFPYQRAQGQEEEEGLQQDLQQNARAGFRSAERQAHQLALLLVGSKLSVQRLTKLTVRVAEPEPMRDLWARRL